MRLDYLLSLKECMRFHTWTMQYFIRRHRMLAYFFTALIIIVSILPYIRDYHRAAYYLPIDLLSLVTIVFIVPIALVADWVLVRRQVTVDIYPSGMLVKRLLSQIHVSWQSVERLYEDDANIYIVYKHKPFRLTTTQISYLLIPRRAFETEGESRQFFEQAKLYWEQAGGETAPPGAGLPLPDA